MPVALGAGVKDRVRTANSRQEVEVHLNKQQAVLLAIFPFAALSLANHFYRPVLHAVHPALYWAADAAHFCLLPLLTWWFLLRPARVTMVDLGMRRKQDETLLFLLFVAGLLVVAHMPVNVVSFRLLHQYQEPLVFTSLLPADKLPRLLVALYASLTAAVTEEIAWRALPWLYLTMVLGRAPPRWAFILGTSLAFAVGHSEQGPGGMIPAFWFGVLTAGLYAKLRTLWPLVLGHFAVDLMVFGPW